MNVQYAGNQYMSRRLIEVIQELRDYLGPEEAHGLSDEEVVHKVMCKAIDYYRQLSELKPKEPPFPQPPRAASSNQSTPTRPGRYPTIV